MLHRSLKKSLNRLFYYEIIASGNIFFILNVTDLMKSQKLK